MITIKEATEIYTQLQQQVSWPILDKLGCLREPHKPVVRTRKWTKDRPIGIGYHYTGGASGLKTIKWFNHPGWNNDSSSCQVIIFDRITTDYIGEFWAKLDAKLRKLFPVPTIILADWKWSTWCTNWMNGEVMGIENRNVGYSFNITTLKERLNKSGVLIGGRVWEPYTREQMICNINIGRVLNGFVDGQLNPDFIIAHYQVHSEKADTGLAFPLTKVRNAIFDGTSVENLPWIADHPMAPDTNDDYDYWWTMSTQKRDEEDTTGALFGKPSSVSDNDMEELTNIFHKMEYNCDPNTITSAKLRQYTKWFQKSTHEYQDSSRHLVVDGNAGPMTKKALQIRLKELHLV